MIKKNLEMFYDNKRDCILYISETATPKFWDNIWKENMLEIFQNPPKHRYTVSLTKKFLPINSDILEGGCGIGDKVFALHKAGFRIKGIDFAPNIVKYAKKNWPQLDIEEGDVRKLDKIKDNSIDGYWSLGVIEHFFDGYDMIFKEMKRVIKSGGFLFITFPMMNYLRIRKSINNGYCRVSDDNLEILKKNFYQFALKPNKVINDLKQHGFTLHYQSGLSSLESIGEQYYWLEKLFDIIKLLPFGIFTKLSLFFDLLFGKYFGHVAVLVLKKD